MVTDSFDLAALIAAAISNDDDAACEQAATQAEGYGSPEQAVVETLDALMRTQAYWRQREIFEVARQRWLHRAAMCDQEWARDRIALEWAEDSDPDDPSPYWPFRGRRWDPLPAPDHAVPAEQTLGWLVAAARRGDRVAAYWAGLMDRHDVESLQAAYGTGVPNAMLSAENLAATAARLAENYRQSDSEQAGHWFREATECPVWEERNSRLTWAQALAGYTSWAHPRDEALCMSLCRQVIDNAVRFGRGDRVDIYEEMHKPLRLDYGRAEGNEYQRANVLRHVVDEHCPTAYRRLQVLLVLSDNYAFGRSDEDRDRVARTLADFREAPLDLADIESVAWELVAVVSRVAIPELLRTIGCDTQATKFEVALSPISFSPAEHLVVPLSPRDYFDPLAVFDIDPVLEAESAWNRLFSEFGGELPALLKGIHPRDLADHWDAGDTSSVLRVIAGCGFDHRRSGYLSGSAIKDPWDLDRFDLLESTHSWLAMWLATSTDLPEGLVRAYSWPGAWRAVSNLMLLTARAVVRHGRGLAETPWYLSRSHGLPDPGFAVKTQIEARLDTLRRLLSPQNPAVP